MRNQSKQNSPTSLLWDLLLLLNSTLRRIERENEQEQCVKIHSILCFSLRWEMDSGRDEEMVSQSNGYRGTSSLDSGHARLNELGYKQELKRDLS